MIVNAKKNKFWHKINWKYFSLLYLTVEISNQTSNCEFNYHINGIIGSLYIVLLN